MQRNHLSENDRHKSCQAVFFEALNLFWPLKYLFVSEQVAALTRRGDGTRSEAVKVKTPGGVPSRPNIDLK